MNFEFATATRIVFGRGSAARLPELVAGLGSRALVVTGSTPSRQQPLLDALAGAVEMETVRIAGEPTTRFAEAAAGRARQAGVDTVVAIGGGSAIDAGKAIASLLTNGGVPLDYLEVIGRGKTITERSAPFVAVPTTAGTGSEVTRNAVLASTEHRVKVSLRSPLMLPHVALVDPALTDSMPKEVTACTGLDALTQVLEPYVSQQSNPLTDGFCRAGMARAARALRRACDAPADTEARDDMALVSLLGGLALANAKLGAVHGFAGPIGGMFDAPHGALCARLLPPVMQANVAALAARQPQSPLLARYEEVARILTGKDAATAADGAAWAAEQAEHLAVPRLRDCGVTEADLDSIVEKSRVASSMQGNPIVLEQGELRAILEQAF